MLSLQICGNYFPCLQDLVIIDNMIRINEDSQQAEPQTYQGTFFLLI